MVWLYGGAAETGRWVYLGLSFRFWKRAGGYSWVCLFASGNWQVGILGSVCSLLETGRWVYLGLSIRFWKRAGDDIDDDGDDLFSFCVPP